MNRDFCSITINGEGLKEDSLQCRIQEISRQREGLLHTEIELRAQVIARSEISEMHNSYHSQLKEHIDAAAKLQVLYPFLTFMKYHGTDISFSNSFFILFYRWPLECCLSLMCSVRWVFNLSAHPLGT